MENSEISDKLATIADLLEIKGDNVFKIRSYRNAAATIDGLSITLKSLVEKDPKELLSIPGIGKGISEKIVELVTTGKCTFLKEILKEVPKGLLELLKISGLGPKKVAMLYDEAGISTISALEKAVKGKKLHGLPGVGEKSEVKLIKAIEDYKKLKASAGRFKISIANEIAEDIKSYLRDCRFVLKVDQAGSLRRWKETIGDLDILASCKNTKDTKDADKIMDYFVNYSGVKDVVLKGSTKTTVILTNGLQVDLRVVEKKSFGAAMQYFTGSKEHNVVFREYAKKRGLKVNEYGVFDSKEKKLAGEREEDIYKAVGFRWMEPELRENSGELIEIKAKNKKSALPDLVKMSDIKGDLHMHTTASDGANTILEMAESAMEMGYEYIAITDHSQAVGVAHGLSERRLLKHIKDIDAVNEKLKGRNFRILKGAEVDILTDGSLDYSPNFLKKLDCVVAAVHSNFNLSEKEMTGRIIKGLSTGLVNIFAHPTGRLINQREPYSLDMEKLMDCALEFNVAMEVNSYPIRLDLKDTHCRLAIDKGLKLSIASDSHSVMGLSNIKYGVHVARRGWASRENILNTMTMEDVLDHFNKL